MRAGLGEIFLLSDWSVEASNKSRFSVLGPGPARAGKANGGGGCLWGYVRKRKDLSHVTAAYSHNHHLRNSIFQF